jgi:eukaryotic-like serine/threonine-protein kinase
MKGKLAYMAPEQVTAKDIDHRADIFALGCVLYEVTVGRRPFQGEGALSTLYQLLEQNVLPPVEACAGYPPELSAIVLRALAKDPEQRFQTAEDMRVALESWLANVASKVNEREIAQLLRATVGDEIDQKSRLINESAARLKEHPSDGPGAAVHSSPPTSSGAPGRGREGTSTVERAVSSGGAREKASSWLLPVGAGLAVLALVAVLAKGTIGNMQRDAVVIAPTVPAASAASGVTTTALAPKEAGIEAPGRDVKITVRTIPANASVQIDDGPPVTAPYTLETAPSSATRTIRASAPSYTSATRQVAFDQTREIVIDLAPAAASRRVKPRARPEPSSASAPAGDSSPSNVREPGTLPPKKPRALDEDNPFAG